METKEYDIAGLTRAELEEQLIFYKNELDRKDQLIRQLMKGSTSESSTSSSSVAISNQATLEQNELKERLEELKTKMSEHKSLLEEKDLALTELRSENALLRSKNLESVNKIETLESTLKDLSNQLKQLEHSREQHEIVVQSLQNDIKEKNAKLFELKSQFRSSEKRLSDLLALEKGAKSKLTDVFGEMSKILQCESTPEALLCKIIEVVQTNCTQKTLLAQKTDDKDEFEFAQRASRETIMRLSGELNKEQKERAAANEALRILREETEKLKTSLEESEQRGVLLNDRIKQLTHALHVAREDANEKDQKLAMFSEAQNKVLGKMNTSQETSESGSRKCEFPLSSKVEFSRALNEFLNHLSHWLSIPKEDGLLQFLSVAEHRIQDLIEEMRESRRHTGKQQQPVKHNDDQTKASYLQRRIEQLESRLASEGVSQEQLRREKLLLSDRLQQVVNALKLDGAVPNLDTEEAYEAVMMRIGQLQQKDTESQSKLRLQITRLQKQLKEAKEKSEALDLQVSVLRNRLIEPQERRQQISTPASQTSSSLSASEKERRRLSRQLQQSKEETEALRKEIAELKGKIADPSQDKLAIIGQTKAMRSNESRINELSRTCETQKIEIQTLTKQLQQRTTMYEEETASLRKALSELERELKSTKESLDVSRRSEKQLLEFRSLVARQLGLTDDQLTVPDYQIMLKLDEMVNDRNNRITGDTAIMRVMEMANHKGDDQY